MLVQSHQGYIHLLPALPQAWPTGTVTGLRARNGFEVTLIWHNSQLVEAHIISDLGKVCRILTFRTLEITSQGQAVPIQSVIHLSLNRKEGTFPAACCAADGLP